jgi:malate dehydrogenase (oxaloacetate-decarboxylating)
MLNALKLTDKKLKDISVVINGAGAAGIAVTRLLMAAGLEDIILCDRQGAVYKNCAWLNAAQSEIAGLTNPENKKGALSEIIKGADAFIGLSGPDCVCASMIKSMAKNPVVFAMANPVPEIMPDTAKAAGAVIVGTGRSDFANQINNVLAFPGIFRGALDVRASDINGAMKIAAAHAIANMVSEAELNPEYILPSALNRNTGKAVAEAAAKTAIESGVARI